jgi:hypothetical protein
MPTTPTTSPAALLTGADLARHYNVSIRTIREWQARGFIPYLKVQRCVRFCLADVEAALRERFEVIAKKPWMR